MERTQNKVTGRRLERVLHFIVQTIEQIFNHPLNFIYDLKQGDMAHWALIVVVAWIGYALFGLSIANSTYTTWSFQTQLLFPFLFLIAHSISLPALYIFHAFLGSRLTPKEVMGVGLVALIVPGILLAGLSPIHWFFAISTKDSNVLSWIQKISIFAASYIGFIEINNLLPQLDNAQKSKINPVLSERTSKQALSERKEQNKKRVQRRNVLYAWLIMYLSVLYKLLQSTLPSSWF